METRRNDSSDYSHNIHTSNKKASDGDLITKRTREVQRNRSELIKDKGKSLIDSMDKFKRDNARERGWLMKSQAYIQRNRADLILALEEGGASLEDILSNLDVHEEQTKFFNESIQPYNGRLQNLEDQLNQHNREVNQHNGTVLDKENQCDILKLSMKQFTREPLSAEIAQRFSSYLEEARREMSVSFSDRLEEIDRQINADSTSH